MKYIIFVILALVIFSCRNSQRESILTTLQEWEHKEIRFPSHSIFTIQGRDTVDFQLQEKFKIITYIDSLGCLSCKLHLSEWRNLIHTMDSIYPNKVQFLFYFSPKKRTEIYQTLLADRFKYPVCIDDQDSINKLNHFPSNMALQTFLLDKRNNVLAIGNPIYNPKIKNLFLEIIAGKNIDLSSDAKRLTSVTYDINVLDMGTFDWQEEYCKELFLKNIGKELLVIDGISSSCGCITVEYSKEPVRLGDRLRFKVKYKAEHPEHFNKTITIYCNTKNSPIQLMVTGNAK